jgi:hypothetical protein
MPGQAITPALIEWLHLMSSPILQNHPMGDLREVADARPALVLRHCAEDIKKLNDQLYPENLALRGRNRSDLRRR